MWDFPLLHFRFAAHLNLCPVHPKAHPEPWPPCLPCARTVATRNCRPAGVLQARQITGNERESDVTGAMTEMLFF